MPLGGGGAFDAGAFGAGAFGAGLLLGEGGAFGAGDAGGAGGLLAPPGPPTGSVSAAQVLRSLPGSL